MLTQNGSYFYHNPETKYRGLFFIEKKEGSDWTLFKTIDQIKFNGSQKVLVNRFNSIEQQFSSGSVNYFFSKEGMIIESDVKGEITLTLDMREMHEFDDKGRIYNLMFEKGCIIIEYKKYTNNVLENVHYTRYLAIKTDISKTDNISQWREQNYPEDEKRRSYPWKLYLFDALSLKNNRKSRIAISFSSDKEYAIEKARKAFLSPCPEKKELKKINTTVEKIFAYNCSLNSLEALFVDFDGIKGYYAGLPWFFQIWTRDEAISLKPIIEKEDYEKAKHILMSRIREVMEDGRLPNRYPFSALGTADGTGWVFKRMYELLLKLKEKNLTQNYFSSDELNMIKDKLKASIEGHMKHHYKELFITNEANETWMDTSWDNDTRQGIRIEIQALWLSMLSLSNHIDLELGKAAEFKQLEVDTRDKVRKSFYDKGIIKDGVDDPTIRPNIFLAYYLYPELFEKEEWITGFDMALEKLWLDWGGLSTIDKSSALFSPEYTGENNKSYHRGDSWFFINNIAAICLWKIDKVKYKDYINKIADAGTTDILYNGIISRPSELSSASSQRAEASRFQLWSASTLIELFELLY